MQNTKAGRVAYCEIRKNGGTKEEAKEAQKKASEAYFKKVIANQHRHSGKQRGKWADYHLTADNLMDYDE